MQEVFIYNGRFSVTECGDVYSHLNGIRHKMSAAPTSTDGKYRAVCLSVGGLQSVKYVHRLVAESFIPNPGNLPQVNHKDGNPSNNAIGNLEWCDQQHNTQHAYDTGLFAKYRCSVCGEERFGLKDQTHPVCCLCQKRISYLNATKTRRQESGHALRKTLAEGVSQRAAEFIDLRAQGMTFQKIADTFGCSRQNVQFVIKYAQKAP